VPDTPPGLSRFKEIVLHQGRIERFFLDHIKKHSKDTLRVERAVLPESLHIAEDRVDDHSPDNYPITVQLRYLTEDEAKPAQSKGSGINDGLFRSNLADDDTEDLIAKSQQKEGSTETVRAKYVVGCDGAHSWTRKQLGFELEGEPTDHIWGVLDIIPITDFPDVRKRCAIHSESSGSMMIIPRENKLARLYIQLTEIKPDASGRADRSKITPDTILTAAQKIIAPYKLTYEYCDWWTAYQIGQRVGKNFDHKSRVFLAGDAVHTHSPKAGQGMNVSMQDGYNLGWKLGLVVKGIAQPSILKTYQSERRRIAQDLIAFDHKFSRLFSGRPAKDVMDEEGVSMDEFKQAFLKGKDKVFPPKKVTSANNIKVNYSLRASRSIMERVCWLGNQATQQIKATGQTYLQSSRSSANKSSPQRRSWACVSQATKSSTNLTVEPGSSSRS
jgi:flavin-dependent dehydrogenase